MATTQAKDSAAAEAWRNIFDLIVTTAPQRDAFIKRLGVSPAESRALASLDPDRGRPMRSLAKEWGRDPSNATWLVDRLERRGWAKRSQVEGDRRVKSVVLTPKGIKVRARLLETFYKPPALLLALPHRDLEALRAASEKLPKPPR